jgi:PAS domain S-box-containing protein
MGTVHVLKDISDRKRAEEKYRTLVSSVQEGVFISTPQGHFLDFNDALMRMAGYATRDDLMKIDTAILYANPADRERIKKLLSDHGSVTDFEFDIRRKDGEIRSVTESSNAIRDIAGVTAIKGSLLDITEQKAMPRRSREAPIYRHHPDRNRLISAIRSTVLRQLSSCLALASLYLSTLISVRGVPARVGGPSLKLLGNFPTKPARASTHYGRVHGLPSAMVFRRRFWRRQWGGLSAQSTMVQVE